MRARSSYLGNVTLQVGTFWFGLLLKSVTKGVTNNYWATRLLRVRVRVLLRGVLGFLTRNRVLMKQVLGELVEVVEIVFNVLLELLCSLGLRVLRGLYRCDSY